MKTPFFKNVLSGIGVVITVAGCCGFGQIHGRTFTDAAGRVLELPDEIRRVYPTSPVAAIYVYTVAPETLVGWNHQMTASEKQFLLPETQKLPVLGGWFGKNGTANLETLLAAKPDVILSFGTLRDTDVDFANRVQAQTGIPVVVGDSRVESTSALYRMLGVLLGKEARSRELSDYCENVFREILEWRVRLLAKTPRVYYAEGLKGLETDSDTSMHTETFRYAGANLVYRTAETRGYGRARVSMEQLLLWQPEVIFIGRDKGQDIATLPEWLKDERWQGLPAFRNNRIYQIPNAPFNWVDRPPSVNRILGFYWVFWCLYPDQTPASFDMKAEIRTFYSLFYHYPLSEAEAELLLNLSRLETGTNHD
jgi:iron complex transport system substrate-binding protein